MKSRMFVTALGSYFKLYLNFTPWSDHRTLKNHSVDTSKRRIPIPIWSLNKCGFDFILKSTELWLKWWRSVKWRLTANGRGQDVTTKGGSPCPLWKSNKNALFQFHDWVQLYIFYIFYVGWPHIFQMLANRWENPSWTPSDVSQKVCPLTPGCFT